MLSRTILSPVELGITEAQHAALLRVLSMLERGELVHVRLNNNKSPVEIPNAFNMSHWDCGTAHCILGWAEVLGASFEDSQMDMDGGLLALCYPGCFGNAQNDFRINDCTPAQAAAALRSYLATSMPDWRP